MVIGVIPYYLSFPTFGGWLPAYATMRIADLSWGNRDVSVQIDAEQNAKLARFATAGGVVVVAANVLLAAATILFDAASLAISAMTALLTATSAPVYIFAAAFVLRPRRRSAAARPGKGGKKMD